MCTPARRMDTISKFDDLFLRQTNEEMMDQIVNVEFMAMLIAMKGEAYSGKTTCPEAIVAAYNCSVISFDHILDSLSRSTRDEERLIDLAFDIILSIVRLQISVGRPVFIDSPLTKQSHLDKLVAVADEFQSCDDPDCQGFHCRFVVVECKPKTMYTWEKRFEDHNKTTHEHKWYKPKDWNDIVSEHKKLSQSNPITPGLHGLPNYVCRLTVDTTYFVPDNYRNLGPATLDICMCPNGHLLDFRDWLPHKPYHAAFNPGYAIKKISGRAGPQQGSSSNFTEGPPVNPVGCGEDGRHMLEKVTKSIFTQRKAKTRVTKSKGTPRKAKTRVTKSKITQRKTKSTIAEGLGRCRACHIDISYTNEEAYACTRCKLALHKSCAELKEKSTIPEPHTNLPAYLRVLSSPDEFYGSIPYEYRSKYKCSSCAELSMNCVFCLWEMHLESHVVPTSVLHEGHGSGEPIWFWVTSADNPREYRCEACKLPGACVGYTCLEGTFMVNFHVECVLLPRPVYHEHGGYHHDMELVFGTDEEKEDYLCDVCHDLILDPAAWYYYCKDCDYVCHLKCIYEQDQ